MRRPALLVCLAIATFLAIVALPNGAAAAGPDLTRLRLFLTEEGTEWSGLYLLGSTVEAYNVVAVSPGAGVTRGINYIGLYGSDPASATVDVVLSVTSYASPNLELRKSRAGTATAKVIRINTGSVTLAEIVNDSQEGNPVVSVPVSRSDFVGEGLLIPKMDSRKLVLAFYYPWWDDSDFKGPLWYDQPTGPYRTNDPVEVGAMVDQARWAGIDGFIYSWDGRSAGLLDVLMDAAEQRPGFSVAVTLNVLNWESNGVFDLDGIEAGAHMVLERAASPAYLTSGGRPVMFVFGATRMGGDAWNQVASRLAATATVPFFVGETGDAAYGFDGLYTYNPNGRNASTLKTAYRKSAYSVRLPAQLIAGQRQLLWAATVSPGMDDFYIRPLNPTREPRRGGARYDDTWYAAVDSDPEWILVTSWNEWYETTQIQPSERFGDTALIQTQSWASRWRNPQVGVPPAENGGLLPIQLPPLKLGIE